MVSFGMGQAPIDATATTQLIEPSTPWMAAADGNQALLESSLTSLGLVYSAADENGYTLLMAATAYNRRNIMELLLPSVDVNARDNDGDTALHHAECVHAVKILVEVGKADVTTSNKSGRTPLQAKQDEMKELMEEDDNDDDEGALTLKEVVDYLSSILSL